MMDFAAARRIMVDGQVRPSGVTDLRLIGAMLALPRERFVPEDQVGLAYLDLGVPVTAPVPPQGPRCLLKPMVLAKLLQAAEVKPHDHVLDVGCATGYSSALLSMLAGSVVALEQEPDLARRAAAALRENAAAEVKLAIGPLTEGWPQRGPYDLILINGATEVRPERLLRQLKEGGRLVCVMRRGGLGTGMLYVAGEGVASGWPIFDAAEPVLPGFFAAAEFVF